MARKPRISPREKLQESFVLNRQLADEVQELRTLNHKLAANNSELRGKIIEKDDALNSALTKLEIAQQANANLMIEAEAQNEEVNLLCRRINDHEQKALDMLESLERANNQIARLRHIEPDLEAARKELEKAKVDVEWERKMVFRMCCRYDGLHDAVIDAMRRT